MLKYDTILWDLDGTLLDFKLSERYALGVCLKKYGISMTEEMLSLYSGINERYWERLERGEVTKQELLPGRFESFFHQMGWNHIDPKIIHKEYERELGTMTYYRDNSYEVVKRLKELGIKQYIVTNGVVLTQYIKMKKSGFDRLIDKVFISDEIGYEKPQIKFFEKAFAQMPDFRKEKALLVGDSLTSDIKGANNVGVDACWYHPDSAFSENSRRKRVDTVGTVSGGTVAVGTASNATEVHFEYKIRNLEEIFDIVNERIS